MLIWWLLQTSVVLSNLSFSFQIMMIYFVIFLFLWLLSGGGWSRWLCVNAKPFLRWSRENLNWWKILLRSFIFWLDAKLSLDFDTMTVRNKSSRYCWVQVDFLWCGSRWACEWECVVFCLLAVAFYLLTTDAGHLSLL